MTGRRTMIGHLKIAEMVLIAEKAARLAPAEHRPVVVHVDGRPLTVPVEQRPVVVHADGRLLSVSLSHRTPEDTDRLLAWWDAAEQARRSPRMVPPLAPQDRAKLAAAEEKRKRRAERNLRNKAKQ